MRQRIRSHLTYANVVATLALFLVIGGGTALASYVVSSNSQIGPGTVSGHKPPSGDHANIIGGSVNGQDLSAGLKSSLSLHCSNGLKPVPGQAPVLCAETAVRDPADYKTALERCAAVNLRLPTESELALVYANSAAAQTYEWTASHFVLSGQFYAPELAMFTNRDLGFGAANTADALNYRCVTTPRN
jgi:hypothetical protein